MKPLYETHTGFEGSINQLATEINWVNFQYARGECFMSDRPLEYQYINNGPVYASIPFHPLVKSVMELINEKYGINLNVCFLNYYLDHTKALGWHSDDSPNIDQTQPIAVVSYGESREIWCKPIDFKGTIPDDWKQKLEDKSLFIMPAGMQDTHMHKIPKGDRVMGPRISLTYRSWK